MALSITEHSRAIRVELLPTKTHFACDAGGITPYKSIHHPSTPPPQSYRGDGSQNKTSSLCSRTFPPSTSFPLHFQHSQSPTQSPQQNTKIRAANKKTRGSLLPIYPQVSTKGRPGAVPVQVLRACRTLSSTGWGVLSTLDYYKRVP